MKLHIGIKSLLSLHNQDSRKTEKGIRIYSHRESQSIRARGKTQYALESVAKSITKSQQH